MKSNILFNKLFSEIKNKKIYVLIYLLIFFCSLIFFKNYGFNDLIFFFNGDRCHLENNLYNISEFEIVEQSTDNLYCVGHILEINTETMIAKKGALVISKINLLKILTILIYAIYPIIFLFQTFGIKLNLNHFLKKRVLIVILTFYIFVFLRYLNTVLTNKEYLVGLNFSFLDFLVSNLAYLIFFIIIYQIPNLIKSSLLLYTVFIFLISIPIFNYFNLASNSFIPLILIFNALVLKIYLNNDVKKINLILLILALTSSIQMLTNVSETYVVENKSWIVQINEIFKGRESLIFESKDIVIQEINNSENSPIIIFWFDELPSSIINDQNGVREIFPNLNNFSKQSHNFLYNNSNSSYSAFSINEVFKRDVLDDVSQDFNFKTIEPYSNICSYELCDFRLQKFNRDRFLSNFYDIAAIYINFYGFEFYENNLPNIYTATSNFWNIKFSNNDLSDDSSIYYDFESTKYLINNLENNDFLFSHLLFPHMPWRYTKDGTIYEEGNSILTSEFLNPPYTENALWWNEDYKNNLYYQNIEIGRLFEQSIYMDKLFGEYINLLKERKLYEKSLIIFAADHGINFNPQMNARRASENNLGVYHVPLIIKLPYQSDIKVINSNTSHTLISELMIGTTKNKSLENIISIHSPNNYVKVYQKDYFKGDVKNGYYKISIEDFNVQVKEEMKYIQKAFEAYKKGLGWTKGNLDTTYLIDITNNVEFKNTKNGFPEKKYFYLISKLNEDIGENIYIFDGESKIKLSSEVIFNKSSEFVFLLNEPKNYSQLKTLKFFTDK